MLNIQQIEALRKTNPQLYETLKRLAGASLGPNQGWSIDDQITDGTNYARVASGALTSGNIDPTKSGVLMKGSVPPTWSGAFTYVSTTSSLTWTWTGLSIFRADGSPMRAERLCLSDIFTGRFGRVTLKKIEAVVEDGQKVTVSCEPQHQFFAGHHAATIVTHNYTFSSSHYACLAAFNTQNRN